ncbi:hypothetical protein H2248_000941 [Termitomyces sp. 'cryptogamus']|nr:hypothetical protein H2248_000941 [Termitomyces sp. 'cryptogamus']
MVANIRLFWAISALYALIRGAHAFSFTTTPPTQCGDLSISWTGGTPPFQLVMYPLFGTQRNVSIPTTAFNNGAGSFTFQLPFPSGKQFVITMSDATGYGSGGTTNLQTTGASQGGLCNTTDPGTDFQFELNSALQQCRPYFFSNYGGAIQPVTIVGTIPGGQTFLLFPPTGPVNYNWNANVVAGTSLLFTMVDAWGRKGGTSDIKIVGATDDAACINSSSPSSTTASVTSTSNSAPSTTANSQTPSVIVSPSMTPEHKTSIAAIAGTVIGGLVFIAVVVTLGLFFLRNRNNNRRSRKTNLDLTYDPAHPDGNHPYSSAVGASGASASPLTFPGGGYEPNPFTDNPPLQHQDTPSQYQAQSSYPSQYQPYSDHHSPSLYQHSSQYQPSQSSLLPYHSQQRSLGSETDSFNPYTLTSNAPSVIQPFEVSDTASTTMSSAQRKAVMAGISGYTPSRFIVHTDVEDELPPPNQDGIVELPPRYSERRGALPTTTAAAGPSHADTSIGS